MKKMENTKTNLNLKPQSKSMMEKWQNPDFRKKQIQNITKRWKNTEYKEKVSEKISRKQKENFQDPERLEKHRQMVIDTAPERAKKMKNKWNDPYFIFRVMRARRSEERALDVIEGRLGRETRLECEKSSGERKMKYRYKEVECKKELSLFYI